MSLALWLALARDLAAILAVVFMGLMAALFWSGQAGLSGGVAASAAVIAAAGLAGLVLYGALSAGTGLSVGTAGLVLVGLVLAGAFYGAHAYGARGLWLAGLTLAGLALAWAVLWAFSIRFGPALGPLGPIAAYLALALFAASALSAASRAAAPAEDAAASERPPGAAQAAARMIGAPPPWFDCAYAALGGTAAEPAQCRFTPPTVAAAPPWAAGSGVAPPLAPESAGIAALERPGEATGDLSAPPLQDAAPAPLAPPPAPRGETPAFDLAAAPPAAGPAAPAPLAPPANLDRPSAPAGPDAAPPESPAAAPEAGRPLAAPSGPARIAPPSQPAAPARDGAVIAGRAAPGVAAFRPEEAAPPAASDAAASPGRPPLDPDRSLTAFVCFPMTSLAADRLCPDQRFGVEDLEVAWRLPGGAARQNPVGVECYADPGAPLHATVMTHLSGDLAALLPRRPTLDGGPGEDPLRKAEAIYEALTRLLSAARAAPGAAEAETRLSLYISGGSSLRAPWAAQSFGPGRVDRLFDLASISQSLAMLRRLREETQALNKNSLSVDLGEALSEMTAERPAAPEGDGAPPHNVVLLILDSLAAGALTEAEGTALGEALAAAGLTAMTVEIGGGGATPALTRLAERSGGVAAAAADAEALFAALSSALNKARRFCAVRVTGPERFFTEGAIELSLRRRMRDGCALEQIASISCEGLTLTERVDPNGAAAE